MRPDINLSYLRTLIAIDETGSFGAASEVVGRTQSAVTQQMQSLERIIGKPLFVTKGRRRELTEAGQTLLRRSRDILALCEQVVCASESSQQTGVVRLGAPLEIANDLLPGILSVFAKGWPSICVSLTIDRSKNLMQMLGENLLDLTLSTWRSGGLEGQRIRCLPVHWIAAEDWRFNPQKPLPLVLTDAPSIFRRIALSSLDIGGWTYYEKLTTHNPAGIRFAVEAGLGLTARTTTTFRSNIRILGEDSGLPKLPHISYYLHRSLESNGPSVDDLYQSIIAFSSNEHL